MAWPIVKLIFEQIHGLCEAAIAIRLKGLFVLGDDWVHFGFFTFLAYQFIDIDPFSLAFDDDEV